MKLNTLFLMFFYMHFNKRSMNFFFIISNKLRANKSCFARTFDSIF